MPTETATSSPSHHASLRHIEDDNPDTKLDRMLAGSSSNNEDDSDPFTMPASGQPTPPSSSGTLEGSQANAVLQAKQLGVHLSLTPYARRELEEFAVAPLAEQALLLYGGILSIGQTVSAISIAARENIITTALLENLQKFSFGVLLSPKLGYYKKDFFPVNRVLAVLTHLNINVPVNFSTDHHVYKEVKKAVNAECTQTCLKIKKAIKSSKIRNQSIYELAVELVKDMKCVVTVPLCARLALLRKVHSKSGKDGSKFWNHVDTRLDLMQSKAGGDEGNLQVLFNGYLKKDHKKYGKGSEQVANQLVMNEWQGAVDEALLTSAAIEAPVGAGDDEDGDNNEDDDPRGSTLAAQD